MDWLTDASSAFWHWVEHMSWVVALVEFPIAIWQLALLIVEQRRVATELGKRANIIVGFEQGADSSSPSLANQMSDSTKLER